jgi:hypothetical protein
MESYIVISKFTCHFLKRVQARQAIMSQYTSIHAPRTVIGRYHFDHVRLSFLLPGIRYFDSDQAML